MIAGSACLAIARIFLPLQELMRGKGSVAFVELAVTALAASTWGWGPALLTAFLSAGLWAYWFLLPAHGVTSARLTAGDTTLLAAFVIAALIVSQLAVRARKRAAEEGRQAESLREGQNRLLEMIAKSAPLNEVLPALAHLIQAQSAGVQVMIVLLQQDGEHVRVGAAPGFAPEYLEALSDFKVGPTACSCGTAMWRREPVIVTDIQADPLWAEYRHLAAPYGLRACWSTPIFSQQGKVLGSFAMYYREVRYPGPAEIALSTLATNIAGIAIERSQKIGRAHV